MKQLTGRENYSKYWVYRGWLDSRSFKKRWWNPSSPGDAPIIQNPQALSTSPYNCIDAGAWYWEAGAASNKFESINKAIPNSSPDRQSIRITTFAINGGHNSIDQRITQTQRIWKIINNIP